VIGAADSTAASFLTARLRLAAPEEFAMFIRVYKTMQAARAGAGCRLQLGRRTVTGESAVCFAAYHLV
jgi:hypothetical protein